MVRNARSKDGCQPTCRRIYPLEIEEFRKTAGRTTNKLLCRKVQQGALMEEKYTLEQIIDAIVQADEAVVVAIRTQDREMLEDVIKDFLT